MTCTSHVAEGPPLPMTAQRIGTETLYREHARFVASYLRHMGAPEGELDDMVQDVFVTAHRKGGYREGPAAPRTWLASLAFRVLLARRRARRRQPIPSEVPETMSDNTKDAVQQLEDRQALCRVQAALQQLSDKHRQVFVLCDVEGMPCEEIALIADVSTGTVYSRLHHARKRFQKAYRAICNREDLTHQGGNP